MLPSNFQRDGVTLHCGDCLAVLPQLEAESVDSIVTDPPYGLSFMGKNWDHGVPGEAFWSQALRVAKPGAHLLAFGGTRTFHRLTCAIEDAGWEIRDCVMWVYGSGFPKSLDVSRAIDKAAGVAVETRGHFRFTAADQNATPGAFRTNEERINPGCRKTAPATDAAKQWQGWGTALKPAWEPVIVARKPLEGTVAANVLKHGTGAINVDGCRVPGVKPQVTQGINSNATSFNVAKEKRVSGDPNEGRWPANLIHDGSEEVVGLFPETEATPGTYHTTARKTVNCYGQHSPNSTLRVGHADTGSAARFFYCAKASKTDRNDGCEALGPGVVARSCQAQAEAKRGNVVECEQGAFNKARKARNHHPTVKPTELMRYLCRLVTPPGGIVLDPFMGSGSTGKAAVLEGFRFVGVEREAEYLDIARARIEAAMDATPLLH